MNKFIFLIMISVSATTAAQAVAADIRVEHAASHAMVPAAKVGDGYLTIVNEGEHADRLLFATSDRAGTVQLHKMTVTNGIMVMRDVKDGLVIPPRSTVTLAPDYHLMFNDVKQPFRLGERIDATLTFERAGMVAVSFAVGRIAGPLDGGKLQADTMSMSGMNMPSAHQQKQEDPATAIQDVLKTMFATPDRPLMTDPVVVQNEWALADWQQDRQGGRVLLKNSDLGWRVQSLGGDSLKASAGLEEAGLSPHDAEQLSRRLLDAESKLDLETVRRFGSFEGTIVLSEDAGASVPSGHEGHGL